MEFGEVMWVRIAPASDKIETESACRRTVFIVSGGRYMLGVSWVFSQSNYGENKMGMSYWEVATGLVESGSSGGNGGV